MSICCCCKNFRKNRLFDVEKERVPGSEGQILSLQINNDWEEVISSPHLANFLPLICHHWGKLSIFFLPVVASLCNNLICNKRPTRTAIHHTPQIYWPCSLPMGIAYFHSKRKHFSGINNMSLHAAETMALACQVLSISLFHSHHGS